MVIKFCVNIKNRNKNQLIINYSKLEVVSNLFFWAFRTKNRNSKKFNDERLLRRR